MANWNQLGMWCYEKDFKPETCMCEDWGWHDAEINRQNAIRTAVELQTEQSGEAPCELQYYPCLKNGDLSYADAADTMCMNPFFITPTS